MQQKTEHELRALIVSATEKGVEQALLKLGVDVNEALEVQKDFAFIRRQRIASEKLKDKMALALVLVVLTGVISLLLVGLKDYFKG